MGSYIEQIKYDNDEEPMWTINEEIFATEWIQEPVESKIASDSEQRKDLQLIRAKDYEGAETHKHEYEEIQRRDKKLREETKK